MNSQQWFAALLGFVCGISVCAIPASDASGQNSLAAEKHVAWHPLTVTFSGPIAASETEDGPNPFLDYRLQVQFTGPSGQKYDIPGYFDCDGKGGDTGNLWQAKFTPDEAGDWSYQVSFRKGPGVAVSLDSNSGVAVEPDDTSGTLTVAACDPKSPGFLKWGRLEYAGGHYLKFREGPYWIRGGVDSPENFLAYAGFDNTPPKHRYADHAVDWRDGDPDWNDGLCHLLSRRDQHGTN